MTIRFSESIYSVVEDTGSVPVIVEVVGLFERELPFNVSTMGELVPDDVALQMFTQSFQPGTSVIDVIVSIVPDQVVELNETFDVLLTSNDVAIIIPDPVANIIILDDDSKNFMI